MSVKQGDNLIKKRVLKELLVKIGDVTTPVFRQVNEGFENEVYDVKTKKDRYIIRVRRKGGTDFSQEVWAIEQARSEGLPVAPILLCTKVSDGGSDVEVMMQNKIKGKELEKIQDQISYLQKERILKNIGELLQRLHSIEVRGFGERKGNGGWQFRNWKSYIRNFINQRRQERELILSTGIREKEFEDDINLIEDWSKNSFFIEPVLCHGDFMPKHIFVDNKFNISSIIDFGLFRGNIPLFDIAYFGFCASNKFIKPLIKGYAEDEKQRNKIEHDLRFQKIALLTKHIGRLAHPYRRVKAAREIPAWVKLLRGQLRKM